jgi:moderate conductance mechanosensitive channel
MEFETIRPWLPWAFQLARVMAILLVATLAVRTVNGVVPRLRASVVKRMTSGGANATTAELEKRARTISGIIRKSASVGIWLVAIMMSLREIGFDLGPILAGAGIAGLAIGFGAQNLVRDVISGFFILLENQIRVNDIAVVNGTGGLVEEINLRTIVLRGLDGTVHIFPNGTITTLSNMTMGYSYYVFDVSVAYKEDTDRVVAVLRELDEEMRGDERFGALILEPLDILGVDKLGDSAVVIKARYKTEPVQQFNVGREMNRRIKKKFDALGIEIPFPHMSVYFGEASNPFRLEGNLDRGQLREWIREELRAALRAEMATQQRRG